MIIAPNSTVWLCSGVKLDSNYRNTKLYNNDAERFAEITSYAVHTVDKCTYIRNGQIKVTIPYNKAYGINYMVYRNSNFENKNFYAFVTNVQYINNDLFILTFTEDVFQTWWGTGYVNVGQCFVAREHCNADEDTIYNNLEEEGLEYGQTYVTHSMQESESHSFKIGALTSFRMKTTENDDGTTTTTYEVPEGRIIGRTYCGMWLNVFQDGEAANSFLKQVTEDGRSDGIISMMMIPKNFSSVQGSPYSHTDEIYPYGTYESIPDKMEGKPFGGYVPKNKKLYQYPYRYVVITNGRGSEGVYKWEYFSTKAMQFKVFAGGYNNPELIISPQGYCNSGVEPYIDTTNVLTNGGAVPCAWTNDAYQAWLAQNQGQLEYLQTHRENILIKTFANTLGTMFNARTSNAYSTGEYTRGPLVSYSNAFTHTQSDVGSVNFIGGATTAMNGLIDWGDAVAQEMAMYKDHEILPPQSHTVSTSGQLAQDIGLSGFTYVCYSIGKEYAEKIDNYFTCYGYVCNKVKTPNLANRKNHNYVKTKGSFITGTAPVEALNIMNRAFDTGITIWHCSMKDIGNYSADNGGVS